MKSKMLLFSTAISLFFLTSCGSVDLGDRYQKEILLKAEAKLIETLKDRKIFSKSNNFDFDNLSQVKYLHHTALNIESRTFKDGTYLKQIFDVSFEDQQGKEVIYKISVNFHTLNDYFKLRDLNEVVIIKPFKRLITHIFYFDKNPLEEFSIHKEYFTQVKERRISVGMPKGLVLLSKGEPKKINRSTSNLGVLEQLVYHDGQLVHIANGKVQSFTGF